MKIFIFNLHHLFFLVVNFTTSLQKTSRLIFNEFSNLTNEQTLIMAFNYTQQLFSPDRPLPVKIPTTLAFDPKSPLRSLVTKDKINPRLAAYNVPVEYDFHAYPPADILAPLYQQELEARDRPVQIILGRKRDPHLVDKEHMERMLESVFTLPRHSQRNSSLAESVGQYIMRKFGTLGLLSGTQVFKPSQFHDMFWEEDAVIDEGSNIIGIYPGENFYSPEDKIIVVGAHWDTTGFTDGFNDNGSGLAAMLEIARALVQSGCRLTSTVIFVAFDKEEVGSQGSHEFVRSYLVPEFFQGDVWPEFQGAFILDTIMNFNETVNSQSLPNLWRTKIPSQTFDNVKSDDFRGNFISLVSRSEPEREIAEKLEKHWTSLSQDNEFKAAVTSNPEKFKLQRYTVELGGAMPDLMELTDHIHFLRSDHARFWYSNETGYQLSLRSVLMTDTGPYRGLMARCYHRDCDSARTAGSVPFASYDFLAMTAQTIVDTITEMAAAQCGESLRAEKIRVRKNEEKDLNILVKTNEIVEEEEVKSNGNAFRVSVLIVAITVLLSFQ